MGQSIRFWRRTDSIFSKTRPGATVGFAACAGQVIGYYAANSKPAMRNVTFQRKSDSAMFDNIAVPGGSGCCNRVIAACAIGLLRLTLSHGNCRARCLLANIVPSRYQLETAMFRFPYTARCKFFRHREIARQTIRRCFPCQQICNESLVNLRLISRYAQYRPGLLTVEKPT